jgi:hypothetical protein
MRRQSSHDFLPAWPLAAAALLLAVLGAATAFDRVRWAAVCERMCGPFALPEQVEALRRSMDWQTPLAWAAAGACLLVLLLSVQRVRRPRRPDDAGPR